MNNSTYFLPLSNDKQVNLHQFLFSLKKKKLEVGLITFSYINLSLRVAFKNNCKY